MDLLIILTLRGISAPAIFKIFRIPVVKPVDEVTPPP